MGRQHTFPLREWVAVMHVRESGWRGWLLAGIGMAMIILLLGGCTAGGHGDIASKLPADIEISLYQGVDVLGSETVMLSDVLGEGKPVVLNMWAGLCSACRIEMPHLEKAYQAYRDEVAVIGVDIGAFVGLGDESDARALLDEMKVTYPAGVTDNREVIKAYRVLGTPSLFFIAPDGEIVKRWAGVLDEDKLTESIQELLAASNS